MNKTITKKNGSKKASTLLGPVSNLEQHLQTDWWKRIFNSMYLKTDADVVEDQKITKSEVELFSKVLELKIDDIILDLACGQGRHLHELARRNFKNLYEVKPGIPKYRQSDKQYSRTNQK